MCRTRIKVFHFDLSWHNAEEKINQFISDPENKITKVNSININPYYSGGLYAVATIAYELGE